MKNFEIHPSSEIRSAFVVALALIVPILGFGALVVDGGFLLSCSCIALVVYAVFPLLVLLRRADKPTSFDLLSIKFAFPVLFVTTLVCHDLVVRLSIEI